MKILLIILSVTGLLLTVVPSFLVFSGVIDLAFHKNLMIAGTLLWFTTAPFWMNKKLPEPD